MDSEFNQMLIAVEDRRFYYHFGIDPIGILRSIVVNIKKRRYAQGGSTITQQLARNLYLSNEKTLSRKLKEIAYALYLELKFSKSQILEMYGLIVYMGDAGYGFESASQYHFGHTIADCSLNEKAMLIAMAKGPNLYKPNSQACLSRRDYVLSLRKIV